MPAEINAFGTARQFMDEPFSAFLRPLKSFFLEKKSECIEVEFLWPVIKTDILHFRIEQTLLLLYL